MKELALQELRASAASRISPFMTEMLNGFSGKIHSIHIVGSAVTPDFHEKTSDINSMFVLEEVDFGFMKFLSHLGKKYKKKGIAAPLIMTPSYIEKSLDVFPVEFLDIKMMHRTIYGEDILKDIHIDSRYLRIQCEREIKTKLIGLRQGFISAVEDKNLLSENLSRSITGYIPLFRAIIYLMGKEPPVKKHDVIDTLCETTGMEPGVFKKVLAMKDKEAALPKQDMALLYENYYRSAEKLGKIIDELQTDKIR